jgi:hypothetical protein
MASTNDLNKKSNKRIQEEENEHRLAEIYNSALDNLRFGDNNDEEGIYEMVELEAGANKVPSLIQCRIMF